MRIQGLCRCSFTEYRNEENLCIDLVMNNCEYSKTKLGIFIKKIRSIHKIWLSGQIWKQSWKYLTRISEDLLWPNQFRPKFSYTRHIIPLTMYFCFYPYFLLSLDFNYLLSISLDFSFVFFLFLLQILEPGMQFMI